MHGRRRLRGGWSSIIRLARRRLVVAPIILALAFAAGRWSAGRETPRKKIDTPALRQAVRLEARLDELEAGLFAGQGWVMEGADLRRRHERVSALQCENADMQLAITARLHAVEQARRAKLRRLAAAQTTATAGPPARVVAERK